MRILMTVVYLVLIIIGLTFAALNSGSVKLNLYMVIFTMPVAVLIAFSLGVGLLLGLSLFLTRYLKLKHEHRKLRHQFKLTEKEIKNLRAIPLHDQH